jgi:hypothetical protein
MIDFVADQDQLRVPATAGDIGELLRLNVTQTGGGGSFLPQIEVWEPCGTKVFDRLSRAFSEDIPIDCAGEFLIVISDDNDSHTGDYVVHVERIRPVYSPKISFDCGYDESIDHAADVDFFVFEGIEGSTMRLTVTQTGGGGSFLPRIEVWNPSDDRIEDVLSRAYSNDFDLLLTGEYLIANSDDLRLDTGSVAVSLSCLFGPCPPDPTEGPAPDPSCSDGVDNDCDGLIDFDDPDCGEGPPMWTISPPTGRYIATELFDLALIIGRSSLALEDLTATFNGTDVTDALGACLIPGTLILDGDDGETRRCPGISGLISPRRHKLCVTLTWSGGVTDTRCATWTVMTNTEP